jgi:CDK-activating kinase assembly factor MAT1
MFSSENAQSIIQQYAEKIEEEKKEQELAPPPPKLSKFSTGISFTSGMGMQQGYLPIPKVDDGPIYHYEEPEIEIHGPPVPRMEELSEKNYLKHIRTETAVEKAGGFSSKTACMRALYDAMQGLYPF